MEKYGLWPVPSSTGSEILLRYVYIPAEMTVDADEPPTPAPFHRAIVDYAKAVAYGSDEDNEDLEAFYLGKFERAVAELRALRMSRSGRGPAQMRVQGYHF